MLCSSFLQSAKAAVTPPARYLGNTLDKFGLEVKFRRKVRLVGEQTPESCEGTEKRQCEFQ